MKTPFCQIFILIFYFAGVATVRAQTTFCPKGAVWNNSYVLIPAWFGILNYLNEKVTYTKDTVVAGDTLKVLTHRFYYSDCYPGAPGSTQSTLIKQKGDTVFFSNARTLNTWQILFNFGATAGSSWQTTYQKANNTATVIGIYVDSVGQVVENGFNLRRLYLAGGKTITERYGNGNLFRFRGYAAGCDGYFYDRLLCYGDSAFGQKVFSDLPCDFSGQIDINAIEEKKLNNEILIVPNPASTQVMVDFKENYDPENEIVIRNTLGQTIAVFQNQKQSSSINVQDYPPGLYYMEIHSTKGIWSKKFVKE